MKKYRSHPQGHDNDLWELVFRGWKIAIIFTFLLFAASLFVIHHLTPAYTASVQMVLPVAAIENPLGQQGVPQAQADMFVVRSYSDVAEDDSICLEIINTLGLAKYPEFEPKQSLISDIMRWSFKFLKIKYYDPEKKGAVSQRDFARGTLLQKYKDKLTAKNDAKSLIFTISFRAATPYDAVKIVDAHAAAFIAAQVAYRQREGGVKAAWMKHEVDAAAEEMRVAQNAIQMHKHQLTASVSNAASDVTDFHYEQVLAASKQSVYETLLARYQGVLSEQKYVGSDIRLLSSATVPIKPSFPKPMLFGAVAAFASLILGFGISAFLSALLEQPGIAETAEQCELPILGSILTRRTLWRPLRRASRRLILFWEDVRIIRSSLDISSTSKAILLTSGDKRGNKSLLAAALARSIAASGSRTLLLDLNFRRPSFYAPISSGPGLRAFFEDYTPVALLLIPLDLKAPLYFLGGCGLAGFPDLDVFGSARMRALIDEVKSQFDVVIVDAPAVGAAADALFIADLVDEVVLVTPLRRGATTDLTFAYQKLRSKRAVLKGIVVADSWIPEGFEPSRNSFEISKSRNVWPVSPRGHLFSRKRQPTPPNHAISFARVMARRLP